jgi:hypothetical protein
MEERRAVDSLEHKYILETLSNVSDKVDKIFDCMYGNNGDGLKTMLARHDEFIQEAKKCDLTGETKLNSDFRRETKSLMIKLFLASVGASGGVAAIWQAISGAIGK